jgi:hypothetical protein
MAIWKGGQVFDLNLEILKVNTKKTKINEICALDCFIPA